MKKLYIYLLLILALAFGSKPVQDGYAFDKNAVDYFNLGMDSSMANKKIDYFTKALELDPRLAAAYEKKTQVKIEISGGGATKGIRQAAIGASDMGGACRRKIPGEPLEEKARMVPVAWDALTVITHKNNPIGNLTVPQLRDIYLGKITNWSQVGGPDEPLHLYIRKGKISGVGRTIRELVFNNYDQDFASNNVFDSTGPLEKAITETPYSIGITGVSSARKQDVKLINLEGISPNYENIASGTYQLYRPLFLAYEPTGRNAEQVQKFIDYALSDEGREVIRQNGTVPYFDSIHLVQKQIKQWQDARKL